ncbi:MAG: exodeoxyribonuclease VII large subunit [Acidobacteria bacterium]|nr:exodeoxyribonuclease VII large subunit [Acidobacteriota bacterium]
MDSPLLRSLFDDEERRPLTISELNAEVKGELERRFRSVWVEGEISNFFSASSGHWYFSLHDADSQLKAVCYKGANWRIRFKPFDGLQVRVRGRITVYEPRGEYQILIESLEPVGEGAIKIAFEQVKAKLDKERLFDAEFKRPLPYLPRRVGVVTSPNGAAFHDILNVLKRRTRSVSIVLIPTRVQGESAPKEIREAVLFANSFNKIAAEEDRIDVLIVGRGGGSAEDLAAFNEELLARAIFESEIPVISAVGHEIDLSISDLVADVRAPTPSAAAEIVAEREDSLEAYISQQTQDMRSLIEHKLLRMRNGLQELTMASVFAEFPQRIRDWKYEIGDADQRMYDSINDRIRTKADRFARLVKRLTPVKLSSNLAKRGMRLAVLEEKSRSAMKKLLSAKDENLKISMASLDALSPLSVLRRGFSLTQTESGEILRDSATVKIADEVKIRLAKGNIKASITEIE